MIIRIRNYYFIFAAVDYVLNAKRSGSVLKLLFAFIPSVAKTFDRSYYAKNVLVAVNRVKRAAFHFVNVTVYGKVVNRVKHDVAIRHSGYFFVVFVIPPIGVDTCKRSYVNSCGKKSLANYVAFGNKLNFVYAGNGNIKGKVYGVRGLREQQKRVVHNICNGLISAIAEYRRNLAEYLC